MDKDLDKDIEIFLTKNRNSHIGDQAVDKRDGEVGQVIERLSGRSEGSKSPTPLHARSSESAPTSTRTWCPVYAPPLRRLNPA